MAQLNFHPAPGLNDLAPGWFALPQNPLTMGQSTALVPSIRATAPGKIVRFPTLADLVAGSFVVPQNPIRSNLVMSMAGLGCGGNSSSPTPWACGQFGSDGGRDFYALNGLGDDTTSPGIGDWLSETSPVASLPNWVLYGGVAVAAWMLLMPGGKEYRQKTADLRSKYRGYRRASRAAADQLGSV